MHRGDCKASRLVGFTVVELLVVVAVLITLAALTLPVFGRVNVRAQSAKSQSNLREVGAALMAYAGDHERKIPPARGTVPFNPSPDPADIANWSWQMHLISYVGNSTQVFRSAYVGDRVPASRRWSFFLGTHAAGRAQEQEHGAFDAATCPPVSLLRIKDLSKHILAGESWVGFTEEDSDKDDYQQNDPAFRSSRSGLRANILFADGHVEALDRYDPTRMSVTYEGITDPPYAGYQ